MISLQHVRNLLATKELRLWHMIVGFALTTVITTGLNYSLNQFTEQRQAVSSQRIAQVTEFLKSAEEFDELTGEYLGKLAATDAPDPKLRSSIQTNIQRQFGALKNADDFLSKDESEQTALYIRNLATLKTALDKTHENLTGGPFGQALADTLVQRRHVVIALRRAARLPTKAGHQSA